MPTPRPSRRDILTMAAAAPALTLPVAAQSAVLAAPGSQSNAGYMRFTLGDAAITIVSDGALVLPTSGLGVNADPEEVQAFLTRYFLSPEENYSHTNHMVIELGDAVVLVDVGSGNRFVDTAGRLMDNLSAAGIDPDAITHVLITHAHPDHIWGIRDDFDEAILPDAAYFMGRAEHDFWMADGRVSSMPTELQQFAVGAVNSISVEGAEWTLLDDGQEIAPGIRVIASPGHTPGHMSVVVESNGAQLMALGDALTHAWMNFDRPDWVNAFDMDAEQTVASRKRLLDMAAADRIAVLGYHFPFPGVGHVMAEGDAYRFVPSVWRW
ncbi:MBL fold metallo-hydrolase [Cognatishimia sp. F0-27]|uniref:MBL fold metallo-hydrolase n=1 Tax=Cognatishimia sp. F0-27 TaxID=2816855 RepID=UPI001D0C4AB2|nr:MBL fold metallo-hydrolase [Cognatishimia sp. F0-27]MCC1491067.1 MBL fold metallo-hydrolase [Cognatishimia sp. F0-27]